MMMTHVTVITTLVIVIKTRVSDNHPCYSDNHPRYSEKLPCYSDSHPCYSDNHLCDNDNIVELRAVNPGGMGGYIPPPQYLTSIPPIISIFAQCALTFFHNDAMKIFRGGGRKMQDGQNCLGVNKEC